MQRRKVGELQALFDLLANQVALLRGDVVPFVDGEHQGPALFDDRAQQARVLFGDIVVRVHHDHDHVSGLDRLQSLDDAEFLDRLFDARAAPDPGRVDQRIALAVAFERHQHGIARGAGLIERHHAILAEQPIDQRALADVRAADDRDFDAGRFRAVLRVRRQSRERRLEQRNHALIMRGRDRMRLARAQLVKIGDGDVVVEAFGFVDRQEQGLPLRRASCATN